MGHVTEVFVTLGVTANKWRYKTDEGCVRSKRVFCEIFTSAELTILQAPTVVSQLLADNPRPKWQRLNTDLATQLLTFLMIGLQTTALRASRVSCTHLPMRNLRLAQLCKSLTSTQAGFYLSSVPVYLSW